MKKIIKYGSAIYSLFLFVDVFQLVIIDLNRMTTYGYGYLTEKGVLCVLFFFVVFLTKEQDPKKEKRG